MTAGTILAGRVQDVRVSSWGEGEGTSPIVARELRSLWLAAGEVLYLKGGGMILAATGKGSLKFEDLHGEVLEHNVAITTVNGPLVFAVPPRLKIVVGESVFCLLVAPSGSLGDDADFRADQRAMSPS